MNVIRPDFTEKETKEGWNCVVIDRKLQILCNKISWPIILNLNGERENQYLNIVPIPNTITPFGSHYRAVVKLERGVYFFKFDCPRHLCLSLDNDTLYLIAS